MVDVFLFCANHNKNTFTVGICEDDTQIKVTLIGGALSAQGHVQGLYVKAAAVNGKLTWIQTSNSTAIWWSTDDRWLIGNKANIGSSLGGLFNPVQSSSPYGNGNWSYYNGSAWVNPIGEIELECETESGK